MYQNVSENPKIQRSVLRKIINLKYFWDVYDVNLWEKYFGRNKYFYINFIDLRKNILIYMYI